MAGGARRLATIACQHHTVLYLILVLLEHLEEGVDAGLRPRSVPQIILLRLRELIIGGKDGEVVLGCIADKLVAPGTHLLATPAYHAAVVYAQRSVGHHELLVDANDASEAATLGAGTHRRVEREELLRRLLEGDAVGLEALAERVQYTGRVEAQHTRPPTLVEGRLAAVDKAAHGLPAIVDAEAVDDDIQLKIEN